MLAVVGCLAVPLAPAPALAEQPTLESLARKVEVLERQIAQLKNEVAVLKGEGAERAAVNEADVEVIVIEVFEGGQIRVEGRELQVEELAAWLQTTLEASPDQVVMIRAEREARFQDVRRVVELCHEAGASRVTFATLEPAAEAPAAP